MLKEKKNLRWVWKIGKCWWCSGVGGGIWNGDEWMMVTSSFDKVLFSLFYFGWGYQLWHELPLSLFVACPNTQCGNAWLTLPPSLWALLISFHHQFFLFYFILFSFSFSFFLLLFIYKSSISFLFVAEIFYFYYYYYYYYYYLNLV